MIEDSWGGDIVTAAVAHLAAGTPADALFAVSFMNDWTLEHIAGYQPRSSRRRRPGARRSGPRDRGRRGEPRGAAVHGGRRGLTSSLSGHPLTPEDIDRVAAIADPIIRNLRITQAYHELSAAAAVHIGPVANWCTYATWASKQAGRTIRKEDLQRAAEAAFRSSPAARTCGEPRSRPRPAGSAPASRSTRRSRRSGRSSIQPPRSIGRAPPSPGATSGSSRRSAASSPGSRSTAARPRRPAGTASPGSWSGSDRASRRPASATCARPSRTTTGRASRPTRSSRAQLVLLANLEVGFHEQIRLQPEITEALDAGVVDPRDVRDRVVQALVPGCRLDPPAAPLRSPAARPTIAARRRDRRARRREAAARSRRS